MPSDPPASVYQPANAPVTAGLPAPDEHERALSERLSAVIRDEIARAGGTLPFVRFMELALYAPGLGYYSAGRQKFGATGDFVTAPEMGNLLARCLARNVAPILRELADGDLLEAGAGSGALAADLLLALAELGQLPRRYFILEVSAELRARQRATLAQRAAHLAGRVHWLDDLPPTFRGVVLGNELLDAMPVQRFRVANGALRELHVAWEQDRFAWREAPPSAELESTVGPRIAPLALADGYNSEIGLAAEGWVRTVAERLAAGVVLLVDYGFPRHEFYHAQRTHGTLMCHYRQRAHSDPLILVGLQDITAHIDFTAVAEAAHATGLDILGYTSQGQFLVASGITDLANAADPKTHLTLTQEIKKLTLPHEMGELFKVIAAGRGVDCVLPGFALNDRRGRL
jgi:SAM-dependent MidA family methyltransferase